MSAIVSLELYGENTYMSSAAVDIESGDICCLKKNIGMLSLVENKRDILRVREQCELSANKPNAGNILWSVPELRNVETKAAADELIVRGEIHLFAMYFRRMMMRIYSMLRKHFHSRGSCRLPERMREWLRMSLWFQHRSR